MLGMFLGRDVLQRMGSNVMEWLVGEQVLPLVGTYGDEIEARPTIIPFLQPDGTAVVFVWIIFIHITRDTL